MKIDSLEIPEGYNGLRASTLSSLSEVVLIAGPNGGGKSRVLQAVRDNCNRNLAMSHGQTRQQESSLSQRLEAAKRDLNVAGIQGDAGTIDYRRGEVDRLSDELEAVRKRAQLLPSIHPDPVLPPLMVEFPTTDHVFQDCRHSATSSATGHQPISELGKKLDVVLAVHHGPASLFKLLADFVSAHSPVSDMSNEERQLHIGREAAFNSLAKEILGAPFSMGNWGDGPKVFGHALESAQLLSAGQRRLLAVLYVLFFQAEADKDVVVIWDEPENHLHPDAVVRIIEKVRQVCPRAQMWIATHSIHILAHFQEHGIWFARDGAVTRGGRVAEAVLSSLLGTDDHIEKLAEFLALPAQRSMRQFAGECLVEPGTLETLPGDPQTTQIFEILSSQAGGALSVLDFGAGKARLLTELVSHGGALARIDYHAYDYAPSGQDRAVVGAHLDSAYGAGHSRYFVGEAGAALQGLHAKFDVVVMCNVLHEVEPTHWSGLFGNDGALTSVLTEQGHLLIVEDYVLAAGERAHDYGFLLLDQAELKVLFNARDAEVKSFLHATEKYRERLKAHVIPREALKRMDQRSACRSIEALRDRSYSEARSLHGHTSSSAKAGHRLALATHQHLNALIALEGFAVTSSVEATTREDLHPA